MSQRGKLTHPVNTANLYRRCATLGTAFLSVSAAVLFHPFKTQPRRTRLPVAARNQFSISGTCAPPLLRGVPRRK